MTKRSMRGNAPMEECRRSTGGRSSVFSGGDSPDGRTKGNTFGESYRLSKFGSNQEGTRNTGMKSNEYGLEQSGAFKIKSKKSRTVKPSSRERTTVTNIKLKHGFHE